jgi:choline dehydrogenase-like flavoprotein
MNTHVLRLHATNDRQTVDTVEAISHGTRFHVNAKIVVLATGGIENARILLASHSPTRYLRAFSSK